MHPNTNGPEDFAHNPLSHEDWQQMLEQERERQLMSALDACEKLGLPKEHMLTLIHETGARFMPDEQHNKRKAA